MGNLAKPCALPHGHVKTMAHVQPIAKRWREGIADRLKVEMLDLHAKLGVFLEAVAK